MRVRSVGLAFGRVLLHPSGLTLTCERKQALCRGPGYADPARQGTCGRTVCGKTLFRSLSSLSIGCSCVSQFVLWARPRSSGPRSCQAFSSPPSGLDGRAWSLLSRLPCVWWLVAPPVRRELFCVQRVCNFAERAGWSVTRPGCSLDPSGSSSSVASATGMTSDFAYALAGCPAGVSQSVIQSVSQRRLSSAVCRSTRPLTGDAVTFR